MLNFLIIYSIIEGFLEKDINDLGSVKISERGKKYISNPEDFYINEILPKKIERDRRYIQNHSTLKDFALCFKLFKKLFINRINLFIKIFGKILD